MTLSDIQNAAAFLATHALLLLDIGLAVVLALALGPPWSDWSSITPRSSSRLFPAGTRWEHSSSSGSDRHLLLRDRRTCRTACVTIGVALS